MINDAITETPCVTSLSTNKSNGLILATFSTGSVAVFNSETLELDTFVDVTPEIPLEVGKWFPDTDAFIAAGYDRSIFIYSYEEKKKLYKIANAHKATIISISIQRRGELYLTLSEDGIIKFWDRKQVDTPLFTFDSCSTNAKQVAWYPKSLSAFVTIDGDGKAKEFRKNKEPNEIGIIPPAFDFKLIDEPIKSFAFIQRYTDQQVIYATEHHVLLCEYNNMKIINKYKAEDAINKAFVHPYMSYVVIISGNKAMFLNITTFKMDDMIKVNQTNSIVSVTFDKKDGNVVYIGTNTTIEKYHLERVKTIGITREIPIYLSNIISLQYRISNLIPSAVEMCGTIISLSPYVFYDNGLKFLSEEIVFSTKTNPKNIIAYAFLCKDLTEKYTFSKNFKKFLFKTVFEMKATSFMYALIKTKVFKFDNVCVEARKPGNEFFMFAFSFEFGDPRIDDIPPDCKEIAETMNNLKPEAFEKCIEIGTDPSSIGSKIRANDIGEVSKHTAFPHFTVRTYDPVLLDDLPRTVDALSLAALYYSKDCFIYILKNTKEINPLLPDYAAAGGSLEIFNKCCEVAQVGDSCMIHAIIHRSDEIFEKLLKNKDVKFVDPEWCVKRRNIKAAFVMIKLCDKKVERTDLAMLCLERGYYPLVMLMIDLEIPMNLGLIIGRIVEIGCAELMDFIIKNIEDPFSFFDASGNTPLHRAIMNENKDLYEFLIKRGIDINIRNKNRETPLIVACKEPEPDMEMVKCIMQNGADINAKDKYGNTPLFYAIANNNFKVAKLLVDSHVNIEVENNNHVTIEEKASKSTFEIKELIRIQKELNEKRAEKQSLL